MTATNRGYRTQEQRRHETRNLLLNATLSCLTDLGYAHSSIEKICMRAGVSKGAVQYHFVDKAELMVAAANHLVNKLQQRFESETEQLTGCGQTAEIIDSLWKAYSGPLIGAVMELETAARTDANLQSAIRLLDSTLSQSLMNYLAPYSKNLSLERIETLCQITTGLIHRLAMNDDLCNVSKWNIQLLDEWKSILKNLCNEH